MKGFYIEIKNNLLEKKHRKAMGTAVWEFMWCLDKITKIDEIGLGWVLGGTPILLREIKEDIGISESKISKNLHKLEKAGYLTLCKTCGGVVVKVAKAKKRFAQKDRSLALKGKAIYVRQDSDKTNNIIIGLKDERRKLANKMSMV